jgi:DNA-binding transcriptional ArsR family regulator
MPFDVEVDERTVTRVDVRPTAVYELAWLLHTIETGRWYCGPDMDVEVGANLKADLHTLFGGSRGCEVDLSILAERVGLLFSEEVDTFLQELPRAIELDTAGLELLSEPAEDRQATIDRLQRLRDDPALARRYHELLLRAWDFWRDEWTAEGLPAVRLTARRWTERLQRGASVLEMLPEKHILNKQEQLTRLLALRPHIVLSPLHFMRMGGFVVDMTSFLHVGAPAGPVDAELVMRKEAEMTAERMKVLADGTRVALLQRLTVEPASVTDLARRFGLAQPTISNHVRMLRDAGLLESRRDGARVIYSAPRERLEQLLADTRHALLEQHC